jgi:hypothetical protein
MNLEATIPNEIRQPQKDKYCMILFTWRISNSQTNGSKEWNEVARAGGRAEKGVWAAANQWVESFSYVR